MLGVHLCGVAGFYRVCRGCARRQVRAKRGRAELVLLDHGLYRRLGDGFRLEYAGLWRALVFGDEAGIRRHAAALGAGDSVQLFAGMLTMRPWDEVTRYARAARASSSVSSCATLQRD